MSNNFKEKEEAKFYKGLIKKASQNLRNKWNRHNFSKGEYRQSRKRIFDKIIEKEIRDQLLNLENDNTRSIIDTIRAMPDIYRTVLEMRFVEERSTKEIAKALSLKETTVDVRIHRGRALLIRKLREEGYIK